MPTYLTTRAIEESTYIITATFTDEDDNPVTPNDGMTWTLTDEDGNVINNRSNVAVTESSSIDIVLSGDDLAYQSEGDSGRRILTLQGTYNSNAGLNLKVKDEAIFNIHNLKNIS